MRNEYLDRLVSGDETDVRGQLNRLLTNSPAENSLYFCLGMLISSHLRLDDFWNPHDQWIDATGFLETEIIAPDTLRIIGYFNWGYLPQASNGNYAPLDATLTLHQDGRLDYDIRTTIDGRPRRIRPDGIHLPATPEDVSVGPRPELFLRILQEKPTGEDPYFLTAPGSCGLRLRIEDDRQRNFQKLSTAAFCLGLSGPAGEAAFRSLLHAKQPGLLPALLQAGGDLNLSDQDFIDFCAECGHSEDEETREAALFSLYFAAGGSHPTIVANSLFLWERHAGEKPFSLNSMWKDRVTASILAHIVAENDGLDAILLNALSNRETAEPALKVLAEMDESVQRFVPALTSFLDSIAPSQPTNLAYHAFEAIRKAGVEMAMPILLNFLNGENLFNLEIAARTFRKIAKEEASATLSETVLENALSSKNLTVQASCELVRAATSFLGNSPRIENRIEELISYLFTVLENQEHPANRKTRIVQVIGETEAFSKDSASRLLNFGKEDPVRGRKTWNEHGRSPEKYLLGQTIQSLGKMGNSTPEFIEFLLAFLLSPDENHHFGGDAAEALVQIGERGHEALLEILKTTTDWNLEFSIVWSFERTPDTPMTPIRREIESLGGEDFDPRYCLRLLDCLRFSKQLGKSSPALLLPLLNRPEGKIRDAVVDLLGRAGDSSVDLDEALKSAANDEDPEVACRARQSLRKLNLN